MNPIQPHLGVPDGARDRIYAEAACLRARENDLVTLFSGYGYREVATPAVEYYDLFVRAGSVLPQEAMQTATARNGRVLAIRPDSTVPLARVAATRLVAESLPLRLFCCQSILRSDIAHRGYSTERRQASVELIGASGLDADLEILRLAAEALRCVGASHAHIELSHAEGASARPYLLVLMENLAEAGLAGLFHIQETLSAEMRFYTGVLFQAYVPGVGEPVLSGGRYDNLLEQLGRPAPALGFAVNLDAFPTDAGNEAASPDRPLRLALTKGRLEKKTIAMLKKAGVDTETLENPGRRLLLPVPGLNLEVVLAKAPDVVTYVEHGVCDMGIVGRDTLMEQGRVYCEMLDLGFGACRFMLAVKKDDDFWNSVKTRRIATKYPHVAREFFTERGLDVEIIKIDGSVELAPILGLSDAIVDIVETGSTLKANGLVPIETIADLTARLVANIASLKTRKSEIDSFISMLGEVLV